MRNRDKKSSVGRIATIMGRCYESGLVWDAVSSKEDMLKDRVSLKVECMGQELWDCDGHLS